MPAERAMIKLPTQFRELFAKAESAQLTEKVGEELAKWASGGVKANPDIDELVADYAKCGDSAALSALEARRSKLWKSAPVGVKGVLKEASDAAIKRLQPVDPEVALSAIRVSKTPSELEEIWESINNSMADVPVEIEAAYNDRKASFE
jgi:hypothetical protein